MLLTYIETVLQHPWKWGLTDCVHFAGDWVRVATGSDPLAPYRGRYDSALEAQRLIRAAGGLAPLVSAEMARCGFTVTNTPEHGDIAVLALANGVASTVIRDGPWWVGRSLEGIEGVVGPDPEIAWRVM